MKKGTLYGLSVGPGDPELMTIKAIKILSKVNILAYPAPLEGASIARQIVDPHLEKTYTEIPIRMPLQTISFPIDTIYENAANQITSKLKLGLDVAVLCEGDSFFYGSFLYLHQRIVESFNVEVIPGVSSPMACAATLGKPLAARNDALIILPATLPEESLIKRMELADSVIIIKVGRHITKVISALRNSGLLENAHYVERASMPNQRIFNLADAPSPAPYFSIIISHRRGLAWR